jgi:hypothetical protein
VPSVSEIQLTSETGTIFRMSVAKIFDLSSFEIVQSVKYAADVFRFASSRCIEE